MVKDSYRLDCNVYTFIASFSCSASYWDGVFSRANTTSSKSPFKALFSAESRDYIEIASLVNTMPKSTAFNYLVAIHLKAFCNIVRKRNQTMLEKQVQQLLQKVKGQMHY